MRNINGFTIVAYSDKDRHGMIRILGVRNDVYAVKGTEYVVAEVTDICHSDHWGQGFYTSDYATAHARFTA